MSSIPGTSATLELLHELKSSAREFAQKDETLQKGWQARRSTLAKSFEAATKQRAAELGSELAALENEFDTARQHGETRRQNRAARIEEAHKRSLKRVLDAIEQREGRQKYTLQKRTLEAERQRESDLAGASSRLTEFRSRLSKSQDEFASLEVNAYQAFSSFRSFRHLLVEPADAPEADPTQDEYELLTGLGELRTGVERTLMRFKRNPLIALFRIVPLWLMIPLLVLAFGIWFFLRTYHGLDILTLEQAAAGAGGALVGAFLLHWLAKALGRPAALKISQGLVKARQWHAAALRKAAQRHLQDESKIKAAYETVIRETSELWEAAVKEADQARALLPKQLEEKMNRARRKNEFHTQRVLDELNRRHEVMGVRLRAVAETEARESTSAQEGALARCEQEFQEQARDLEQDWQTRARQLWERIQSANAFAERLCPAWTAADYWQSWSPPQDFKHAVPFGSLEVDLEKLAEVRLREKRMAFPGPHVFSVPLMLKLPEQASLLFETGDTGGGEAIAAMNTILFRLLALGPPGKLSFTIFDPIGLGQNFAGIMHLADYEDSQVSSRIWTQASQMEEKLGELNEHMEKVIQMYLRNEYATIAEYNTHAGAIAEKYHFLVIAGFPMSFSEAAGRRLLNIAASGARCGVYTIVQWDRRLELPHGFLIDELRKNSIRIVATEQGLVLGGQVAPGIRLRLEAPPPSRFATDFLRKVGQSTKDSNRVELPFTQIAPSPQERWTEDASSELRVPIGRSGAAKLQYLAIGRGTRQHALIAGKTGSGKSTLFHVMITNIALWCSPAEVEFYLVDFKKGVEFKCYADSRLPHAKVVAIESDREFGLSVLQRVDDELRRRGDLFRKAGVQDLTGYRKAVPDQRMPRLLLMIDEFQEFFTEEDRISQSASVLLDRIVRQGRAFGIHVLLGSQTLGGAYTLARATMGQMVIRIALQCNEADAYLIMDETNAAPRLLSRPGEGIYNDMAGALEGNSPFQVAWLPDDLRDKLLGEVHAKAAASPAAPPGPIVFEGNAPADVRDNPLLVEALRTHPITPPLTPRVWLGAPNSIKGPTEVVFRRQSGNNLLVVGQREEVALSMAAIALVSLAAQHPAKTLRLLLLECTVPGSPERAFLDRAVDAIPHPVERPKRPELGQVLNGLTDEILHRTGEEPPGSAPTTFLVLLGLQDFKQLRAEDEFALSGSEPGSERSSAAALSSLISDGPSRGCHVVATVDSYNNVSRFLGRKGLSEFESRVLFQMSASDSASLIDNPDAGKLGLHRALLYNEREGYLEKFRPYALPGPDWLRDAARALG